MRIEMPIRKMSDKKKGIKIGKWNKLKRNW